ncbi:MAG: elongation factor Ts [Alphaproteobacteria bacterium]|jgi:elongation factor Ts
MTITASMVKELRDATGAGMMDAKRALVENDGNFDNSVDFLRKNGLAKAAKKSDRVASEGLVVTAASGNKGVVLEVNSETDFVAKNESFKEFVTNLANIVLETGVTDPEALKAEKYEDTTVGEKLVALISKIGENMNIRRAQILEVPNGVVNGYVHMGGKIGVLVAITGEGEKLSEVARHIAMHVAASNPQFLDRTSVDQDLLAKERAIYTEQAAGKPENIVTKIVEGRLNKFCEEICLVDQAFVMDTDRKVGQVVAEAAEGAKLSSYVRFGLGDGIEKKEEDFAAEVAATMAS